MAWHGRDGQDASPGELRRWSWPLHVCRASQPRPGVSPEAMETGKRRPRCSPCHSLRAALGSRCRLWSRVSPGCMRRVAIVHSSARRRNDSSPSPRPPCRRRFLSRLHRRSTRMRRIRPRPIAAADRHRCLGQRTRTGCSLNRLRTLMGSPFPLDPSRCPRRAGSR